MRYVIPISGKDSLTTAIVQKAKEPELNYEYFYNVTGAELPEINNWLDLAQDYLGQEITRIGSNLTQIIYEQGILPSRLIRYCTRLSKIIPMEVYLGKEPATVYFGIRADENRIGYKSATRNEIIPSYPLQEVGITIGLVYRILGDRNLMPPDFFWDRLYQETLNRLGFQATELGEMINSHNPIIKYAARSIFSGRKRPNCFYCFNQSASEFLWLYETHFDLFSQASKIENEVGADGYTWRDNWPLERIVLERDSIFERRVKQAQKNSEKLLGQLDLRDTPDLLSHSTCGLVCGK